MHESAENNVWQDTHKHPSQSEFAANVLLLTQRFFDHIHDERQKSQNGRVPWSCFTKRAKFSVYPNTSSTCSLHSDRLPVAAMSSSFYEQKSLPSSSPKQLSQACDSASGFLLTDAPRYFFPLFVRLISSPPSQSHHWRLGTSPPNLLPLRVFPTSAQGIAAC